MIEFQVLALLLIVPIVYILMATLDVQRTVYGVTQAAREAGRVAATTGDERLARLAAAVALRDQGVGLESVEVSFACQRTCDSAIDVTVRSEVPLPYLPAVLVSSGGLRIPVQAAHTAPVDRYAAR